MNPETVDEGLFRRMVAEWRSQVAPDVVPSEAAFDVLAGEYARLQATGQWVSGPGDVLTILRRHRDELLHSRMLGWLLQPSGRHALGDAFLRAFLAEAMPGIEPAFRGVSVDLEVTRSGPSALTGLTLEARADIVLSLESMVVVIENKVDAGEQRDQCERLYWPWAQDPVETHWVFLSPSGRAPITATSQVAAAAWRSMSYTQVRRAVDRALEETADRSSTTGRSSVQQYLATLVAQHH